MLTQKELNNFERLYFDPYKKRQEGIIVFDGNTCPEHKQLIIDICMWATVQKLNFYTRVYLKGGEIADLVIPELPKPILEIRHSELEKKKEYLQEYDLLRKMIDTSDPWRLK